MDTWTLQAGYPVVRVEGVDQMNARLSQKRFFMNSNTQRVSNEKWIIPINFAYPKASSPLFNITIPTDWMVDSEMIIPLNSLPYVMNVQETGFYRVNYDDANWKALSELLNSKHLLIHELNRGQIVDDALNLARSQKLDYQVNFLGSKCKKIIFSY